MKKHQIIGLLLISIIISSCAMPHYQHIFESSKGLDFRTGKWLVNNIETNISWKSKEALTNNLLEGLKDLRGDSVYFIDDIQFDYLVPSRFKFNISSEVLNILNKTTDFDYLVNVKALKKRNEVSDIILSNPVSNHKNESEVSDIMFPNPISYKKSESEVWIIVYEIKTGFQIYSHRIIATVELDENDDDVTFAKSAHSLIFGALKKGLKEMRKNSVNNE